MLISFFIDAESPVLVILVAFCKLPHLDGKRAFGRSVCLVLFVKDECNDTDITLSGD